jgi:hypothetical protein
MQLPTTTFGQVRTENSISSMYSYLPPVPVEILTGFMLLRNKKNISIFMQKVKLFAVVNLALRHEGVLNRVGV